MCLQFHFYAYWTVDVLRIKNKKKITGNISLILKIIQSQNFNVKYFALMTFYFLINETQIVFHLWSPEETIYFGKTDFLDRYNIVTMMCGNLFGNKNNCLFFTSEWIFAIVFS